MGALEMKIIENKNLIVFGLLQSYKDKRFKFWTIEIQLLITFICGLKL